MWIWGRDGAVEVRRKVRLWRSLVMGRFRTSWRIIRSGRLMLNMGRLWVSTSGWRPDVRLRAHGIDRRLAVCFAPLAFLQHQLERVGVSSSGNYMW